jgi:two-component system KDP operon response regulator KdpE
MSDTTLIILSARDATDEKVAALDLGADDYLTKPFDTDELLARVRVALRNRMARAGGEARVSAGDIDIDLLAHIVTRNGQEVHLTPKEYAVLAQRTCPSCRISAHPDPHPAPETGTRPATTADHPQRSGDRLSPEADG